MWYCRLVRRLARGALVRRHRAKGGLCYFGARWKDKEIAGNVLYLHIVGDRSYWSYSDKPDAEWHGELDTMSAYDSGAWVQRLNKYGGPIKDMLWKSADEAFNGWLPEGDDPDSDDASIHSSFYENDLLFVSPTSDFGWVEKKVNAWEEQISRDRLTCK